MEAVRRIGKLVAGLRSSRVPRWLLSIALTVSLGFWMLPGITTLRSADDEHPAPSGAQTRLAWDRNPDLEQSPGGWEGREPVEYAALHPEPSQDADPWWTALGEEASGSAPGLPGAGGDPSSRFDCIIEAYEVVEIGSTVTGLIESVHVERADIVEKGQVLVKLESSVERASLELARYRAEIDGDIRSRRASLTLGERRRKRAEKLFENNALSSDLKEEAETEAVVARLELQQARENQRLASLELEHAIQLLTRRIIVSPIPGVVVERLMSSGEVVDEETILTVAQIDPLRVEVVLPAAMFGSIQPGTRAAVVPEFPGDQVHVASVTIVDRIIDAASGTFRVLLELPNPDHRIPGGLHCQARFISE